MSQELERRAAPSIEESFRIAKGFAMSGYFPDAATAEKAFVKIMAGAEMGLAPFQSMKGIDVIKGQTFLKPALLRGLLDNSPDYDYEIAWEDDACTVSIFKNGKHRGDSRFSMADAETAGLATKENYQKFERNMLLERATSNAVRWYAAGLTMGPAYITGEEVPDVLPPHIQALDAAEPEVVETHVSLRSDQSADENAAVRAAIVTPAVTGYIEPDDAMEDVPFEEVEPPAADPEPAPAESPDAGIITTLEEAQRLVNALDGPQLGVMKRMLSIDSKTTRRLMADALFEQKSGWDSQDVLAELAGWA